MRIHVLTLFSSGPRRVVTIHSAREQCNQSCLFAGGRGACLLGMYARLLWKRSGKLGS